MKLVILLLGISLALGYEEPYQGFNECGMNGWSCAYVKGKYEITYTCPKNHPNARVWVWTARLPTGASIFVVQNCNHLEVHFDCTTGLRTTVLREFRVINVTNLEILPPLLPMTFLHDNDQIPQAPPILLLSNVTKIKLYPGVFDKPGGGCRYKFLELVSLTLDNVHIDRIMKDLFRNQNMNTLVMKNVVIDAIDSNAMVIAADSLITRTIFPFIPSNAISLRGKNISFIGNTFHKIQTSGLLIKCKEFKFSNNYVEEINTQGLDVLGAKIEITKNVFIHLETGAFQKMTPAYSSISYEIASKFIYNFSDNILKNINPGSVHLNWEIYKKVCSDLIFKNNIFDCSCINLGWISWIISNGLGQKISKVKEFYDMYLNTEDNMCNNINHCPLNAVIAQIQDVCSNKTNISMICSSVTSITEVTTISTHDESVVLLNSTPETSELNFQTQHIKITEKVIPLLSYTENQMSHLESGNLSIWFIVLIVILILAAVSLGMLAWWYKKKNQRQMVMTMYKNEKGLDADSLIVINEHHNELYDKQ